MLGKEEEEETAGTAVAGLFCRGCKMDGTLLEFGSGVMSGTGSDLKFFQKLDLREPSKFR